MTFFKITAFRAAIIKCIIGFLALAFSVGPPMAAIGIAMMTVPSSRTKRIDQYNAAGNKYNGRLNTLRMGQWGNDSAILGNSIGGVVPNVTSEAIKVTGELKRVDTFVTTFTQAKVAFPAGTTATVSVSLDGLIPFTISNVPVTARRAAIAVCESAKCTSAEMTTGCQTRFGPTAAFSGPATGCEAGYCHECTFDAFLEEICVPVEGYNKTERQSGLPSCFYPFAADSAKYINVPAAGNPRPTTMKVTLRAHDDPFLNLQFLTKGSTNFGPNKLPERMSGYGLLVSGIIMTLLFIALALNLRWSYNEVLEEEEALEARRIKNSPEEGASSPAESSANAPDSQ